MMKFYSAIRIGIRTSRRIGFHRSLTAYSSGPLPRMAKGLPLINVGLYETAFFAREDKPSWLISILNDDDGRKK